MFLLIKPTLNKVYFGLKFFTTEQPFSKIHVARMGPIWVLSAPGGPHVSPMNLAQGMYVDCIPFEITLGV